MGILQSLESLDQRLVVQEQSSALGCQSPVRGALSPGGHNCFCHIQSQGAAAFPEAIHACHPGQRCRQQW